MSNNNESMTERVEEIRAVAGAEHLLKRVNDLAMESRLGRNRLERRSAWLELIELAKERTAKLTATEKPGTKMRPKKEAEQPPLV